MLGGVANRITSYGPGRVTFIEEHSRDTHEVRDVKLSVERSQSSTKLEFATNDAWPDTIVGVTPSIIHGWEIVVTDVEDNVYSGTIEQIGNTSVRFQED